MSNSPSVVSIGMPVYNGELFLRGALDSLLAQSFGNFELIISDNGSNDGTELICREFARNDSRISYIKQPTNNGAIWNFNFVLQQAQGEYFMWAAHDDLWDKEWIAKLLRNYSNETAISFGHIVNINEDGKLIKNYPCVGFSGGRLRRLVSFYLAEDTRGKPNLIYGLYKTDMLKRLGFKEYGCSKYGQDMHFIFSCLQYGIITTDSAVLLYKRIQFAENGNKSIRTILSSLFLLQRAGSYLAYPLVLSKLSDKIIIAGLFPIKYMASFIYNFLARAGQYFFTQEHEK